MYPEGGKDCLIHHVRVSVYFVFSVCGKNRLTVLFLSWPSSSLFSSSLILSILTTSPSAEISVFCAAVSFLPNDSDMKLLKIALMCSNP